MREEDALDECLNYMKTQIGEHYFNGSGLTLDKIQYMDLWAAKTKELKGGCFKKTTIFNQSYYQN